MKLALHWRKPADDVVEADEESVASEPQLLATGAQVVGSTWTTKAIGVGLGLCLFGGLVGGLCGPLALASAGGAAPVQAAPSVDHFDERAMAQEFAQRVVSAWLRSTRTDNGELAALVADTRTAILPEAPFQVKNLTTESISSNDGVWSVTVAADVTGANGTTTRRFFALPVSVNNHSVAALTLPAAVSGPQVSVGGPLAYRAQIDPASPLGQSVAQFLSAYAAGTGDITRYLTPGAQVSAIAPAPFAEVAVVSIVCSEDVAATAPRDGVVEHVRVEAQGRVSEKQFLTMSYLLTLTARAQRWEVSSVDPAPLRPSTSGSKSAPDGAAAIPPFTPKSTVTASVASAIPTP